ncbi:MAG: ABC transporter ATP-binding protein [Pseudomonadota bacterium]
MAANLLDIRDLSVSFEADEGIVRAVSGVSFSVPAKSTVALVGESGSGKTVISQSILGILPENASIDQGEIMFSDPGREGQSIDLAPLKANDPVRRRIRGGRMSIVFQEPMSSLSPLHTIGDQIGEALKLHSEVSSAKVRSRTEAMLARVGFADPAAAIRAYPFELSGGLRQRAMIAMALICEPALLIADEPTTALDVTIQAQILRLMKDLQDEFGMSILFITHDLGVVANMADEVVVMFQGQVMEKGPCHALIKKPRHPYLRALMHAVPTLHMDRNERLTAIRDVSIDETMKRMSGAMTKTNPTVSDEIILEVEGITKTFGSRRGGPFGRDRRSIKAVLDLSFEIRRGESFAIVGESGCGKSTLSKLIMRGVTPDSGTITFREGGQHTDVLELNERELLGFRRKIQYMFQDPFGSLNPRMTVFDIISEPMIIHGIGTEPEQRERVRTLLEAVGLSPQHLRRYPHSFSGGQRQRIGIARALALEPDVLICDEPVSALDVSVQAQILNLLKDLQRELGLTYLFISHNLAVVRYIADRIAVMCAGQLVEIAETDELFANPQHPYTKALLAAVPEPDLDNLLDFAALDEVRSSEPRVPRSTQPMCQSNLSVYRVRAKH